MDNALHDFASLLSEDRCNVNNSYEITTNIEYTGLCHSFGLATCYLLAKNIEKLRAVDEPLDNPTLEVVMIPARIKYPFNQTMTMAKWLPRWC